MKNREEIDREELMGRIGRVRRAAGLSQAEFSRALNAPLCHTELAEHGALICCDENRIEMMEELFSERELAELLQKISTTFRLPMDWLKCGEGNIRFGEANESGDELVFYFPMTVSCNSLVEELKKLMDLFGRKRLSETELSEIGREGAALLMLKFKAYYKMMQMNGKASAAKIAKNKILEFINGYLAI